MFITLLLLYYYITITSTGAAFFFTPRARKIEAQSEGLQRAGDL